MAVPFDLISNIAGQISIPDDGTLSRTVFQDESIKVVLFGFAPGQELSEHTASMPAIIHFLEGEAGVGLGDEQCELRAGDWVHMAPRLRHSISAKTPVKMLLILLKSGELKQ